MFSDAFKNRKVLVTGHTGFKGSWLAIWLRELGADVVGYSLAPPSEPNNFEATRLEEKITHIHGDINDLDGLIESFKKYQPEFVFHLAAQPLVRLSYDEPKMTFDTNVGGTVNVFEAVRKTSSVKVLVNITSDKCYENREWVWGYRENDPMGGHDPYSASKGCAELVFSAYLKSFFSQNIAQGRSMGAASARAGNVVGGGDWGKDRLVPDCVRALSRNEEIVLRYPQSIRPWQHVLEPLGGYLLLGAGLWQDGLRYVGSWNFGPSDNDVWTVEEVVREIIRLWGQGSYRVESDGHPHEAHWLKLDWSKARVHLGWHPWYNIQAALSLSIDWYRLFYAGDSKEGLYRRTADQIAVYMAEKDRGV